MNLSEYITTKNQKLNELYSKKDISTEEKEKQIEELLFLIMGAYQQNLINHISLADSLTGIMMNYDSFQISGEKEEYYQGEIFDYAIELDDPINNFEKNSITENLINKIIHGVNGLKKYPQNHQM